MITKKIEYVEYIDKGKKIVNDFEDNFKNMEDSHMAEQLNDTILINNTNNESINKGISSLITLQCRVWLDNNEYVNLAALLDTRSTKSIIGYDLIPKKFHTKLDYHLITRTVENRNTSITHEVKAIYDMSSCVFPKVMHFSGDGSWTSL